MAKFSVIRRVGRLAKDFLAYESFNPILNRQNRQWGFLRINL